MTETPIQLHVSPDVRVNNRLLSYLLCLNSGPVVGFIPALKGEAFALEFRNLRPIPGDCWVVTRILASASQRI
ncbi:MAG: hypothetical protein J07HR59_01841 [Halorubrum sp. J07HR59]|nr:MAG: hypothetical protein J07HR59_01841 [Halorubrum sp. J07HR59]